MKHLIFYTAKGTPNKPYDESGAFIPEALALFHFHTSKFGSNSATLVPINCLLSNWNRRTQVMEALAGHPGQNYVSFFCHGWKTGIQQGFRGKIASRVLANALISFNPNLRGVNLYACSTAKGPENFAKWLSEYILKAQKWPLGIGRPQNINVFGHYNAGHTSMNPCCKIYRTHGLPLLWGYMHNIGYNDMLEWSAKRTTWNAHKVAMRKASSDRRWLLPFTVRQVASW